MEINKLEGRIREIRHACGDALYAFSRIKAIGDKTAPINMETKNLIDVTSQKKRIDSVTKEIALVIAEVGEKPAIRSQKDLEAALTTLGRIGERKKLYQEKIDGEILNPIKTGLKNLEAMVRPYWNNLVKAEGDLKLAMGAYKLSLQKAAEKKEEELTEKVAAGKITISQAATRIERIEKKAEPIPTRKIKELEITKLDLIPEEYWILDFVAIRRDLIASKEVPGARMVEKEIVVNKIPF